MLKVQVTKHLGSVKIHLRNRLFQRVIGEQRNRHGTLLSYLPVDGRDPYHNICWQETSLPHCLCGKEGWKCESILLFCSGLKLLPTFPLTLLKEKM